MLAKLKNTISKTKLVIKKILVQILVKVVTTLTMYIMTNAAIIT